MLSISILPRLLLAPIAGVFGDWFDRKKTIVILDFFNGLLIAGYALVFFYKWLFIVTTNLYICNYLRDYRNFLWCGDGGSDTKYGRKRSATRS